MQEGFVDFNEFCRKFDTEHVCFETLFAYKWPTGYACPRCDHRHASKITTRRIPLYQCLNCNYQASLICDTVMEGTRTKLYKWFQAIFLLSHPAANINATKLSQIISVTYKTAWLILHKLRDAIHQADLQIVLTQAVKVNAGIYNKPLFTSTPYILPGEQPFIGAASVNQQGEMAYAKLKHVVHENNELQEVSRYDIEHYIKQHVRTNNVINESRMYFRHRYQPLSRLCRNASVEINRVYHGVSPKHLQAYFDELCFRINYSLSSSPATSLSQLLQIAATSITITYRQLTSPTRDISTTPSKFSAA
ncbi:transposase [Paenibacillus swuensis]|uniref:transposase n=1 Tax=Paenibacillus swuensis TaxID=1178515 RepID=UPI0008381563|nr:transposase [Paenibacillus swuensis]